jgi:hypothetical protein
MIERACQMKDLPSMSKRTYSMGYGPDMMIDGRVMVGNVSEERTQGNATYFFRSDSGIGRRACLIWG